MIHNHHYASLGPLPTTRRARYVFRRKRYLRRRRRMWASGGGYWKYPPGPPVFHPGLDWTLAGDGTKQRPPGLVPEHGHGPEPFPPPRAFFAAIISPASQGNPPTERLFYHGVPFTEFRSHFRYEIGGYFKRRITWAGHKLHPKTDGKRRPRAISYASFLFRRWGTYPDWDPLHRHPADSDP